MFKHLYARLAAVLLGLFLVIGIFYILLTIYTTRLYFQEVSQKLNRVLAQQMVSEKVLMGDGRVNDQALQNIFHMLMVVNPGIEVYLLGTDGRVLAFSAPPGKVKRQSVSLGPIAELLRGASSLPVLGDDPRDLASRKVFSVAPVMLNGRTSGYLYIILGGEEFDSTAHMLQGSYILKLSLGAAAGGLLFALLAALLLFNRLTRPLRQLTAAMEDFRQGGFSEPSDLLRRLPPSPGNEINMLAAIFREMTGRIVVLIRELKSADAHRREFLANIAHDLRTPLTSLQGYLETLLMKEGTLTPEEQRTYITIAMKRSDQMSTLVTELSELAKLDSPDVQVRFEPLSLQELIQDILQKFQLTGVKKKIALKIQAGEDLPLVFVDVGLCERVLDNLIDNALRYTPENGSITVSAAPAGDRVVVRVSDTGAGISQEDIPHLFDRYYRSGRNKKDKSSGSGLGLAIAKRIAELHGSSMEVSSTIDVGTTFTFTLPLYKPSS